MAEKIGDDTYVCDCGEKFDSAKSLCGHSPHCDEYRKLRVERECQECGGAFEVKESEVERGKGKYCSTECKYKSIRLYPEERADDDYGPLWSEQRSMALARDNWECQRCGIGQTNCREQYETGLHVHHKTPYREFDDDEQAHRLDNLVTLCPPCHRTVEQLPSDIDF